MKNKIYKIKSELSLFFSVVFIIGALDGCAKESSSPNTSKQNIDLSSSTASNSSIGDFSTTSNESQNTEAQGNEISRDFIKSSILLKITGCSYSYSESDHKLSFSYDDGKVEADFPSKWASEIGSFCVSPNKTAVVCFQNDSVVVECSDDKGKTWNSSAPILSTQIPTRMESSGKYLDVKDGRKTEIDFASKDCGYLVICGNLACGSEYEHDLFKTVDGGKTWRFIDSNLPVQSGPLTDMHFTDSKTGYICSSCDSAFQSEVWRTSDGGATWTFCDLPIISGPDTKDKYKYDTTNAFAPYFVNSKCYILVYSNNYENKQNVFIYCVSSDNGKTWKYETTKYDLTSDF